MKLSRKIRRETRKKKAEQPITTTQEELSKADKPLTQKPLDKSNNITKEEKDPESLVNTAKTNIVKDSLPNPPEEKNPTNLLTSTITLERVASSPEKIEIKKIADEEPSHAFIEATPTITENAQPVNDPPKMPDLVITVEKNVAENKEILSQPEDTINTVTKLNLVDKTSNTLASESLEEDLSEEIKIPQSLMNNTPPPNRNDEVATVSVKTPPERQTPTDANLLITKDIVVPVVQINSPIVQAKIDTTSPLKQPKVHDDTLSQSVLPIETDSPVFPVSLPEPIVYKPPAILIPVEKPVNQGLQKINEKIVTPELPFQDREHSRTVIPPHVSPHVENVPTAPQRPQEGDERVDEINTRNVLLEEIPTATTENLLNPIADPLINNDEYTDDQTIHYQESIPENEIVTISYPTLQEGSELSFPLEYIDAITPDEDIVMRIEDENTITLGTKPAEESGDHPFIAHVDPIIELDQLGEALDMIAVTHTEFQPHIDFATENDTSEEQHEAMPETIIIVSGEMLELIEKYIKDTELPEIKEEDVSLESQKDDILLDLQIQTPENDTDFIENDTVSWEVHSQEQDEGEHNAGEDTRQYTHVTFTTGENDTKLLITDHNQLLSLRQYIHETHNILPRGSDDTTPETLQPHHELVEPFESVITTIETQIEAGIPTPNVYVSEELMTVIETESESLRSKEEETLTNTQNSEHENIQIQDAEQNILLVSSTKELIIELGLIKSLEERVKTHRDVINKSEYISLEQAPEEIKNDDYTYSDTDETSQLLISHLITFLLAVAQTTPSQQTIASPVYHLPSLYTLPHNSHLTVL